MLCKLKVWLIFYLVTCSYIMLSVSSQVCTRITLLICNKVVITDTTSTDARMAV